MLRNEGDGRHDQRHAVSARPDDLLVGRWPDPLQRTDTALIADDPVQVRQGQPLDDRRGGALALPLIGIAAPDDAFRRTAERRVGKECVSTCRSRWSPYT